MPPEAQNSKTVSANFGVAGVLASGSRILYENVFSNRNIGRIMDLVVARLREGGADERTMRSILLYSLVEACQHQEQGKPVLLECGIDESHFAVTVSFQADAAESAELSRQAGAFSPQGGEVPFEGLFHVLQGYAHRMFLRYQPESRRYELGTMVYLAGPPESDASTDSADGDRKSVV